MTLHLFLDSAVPVPEATAPVPDARPMRPEVALVYRRYIEDHHGVVDPLELLEVGFHAGERHALTASTIFADIPPGLRWMESRIGALCDALEGALSRG